MQRVPAYLSLALALAAPAAAAPRGLDPLVIPGVGAEDFGARRLPRQMVRIETAPAAPASYALAPPQPQPQRGHLGGGLIEALVGGARAEPRAVLYNAPPQAPRALTRQASLGAPSTALEVAPRRAIDPAYLRSEIDYSGPHRAGTIVVDTPNKYLYLVQPGGRAIRYGIGVGRPGFTWSGVKQITRKAEWPDWRPPPEMLRRRPDLPIHMEGGPANPLGARALYLGSSLYRIHGTNEPHTIGQNVSSGCIRMMNEDVSDLYDRVKVGARVVVM